VILKVITDANQMQNAFTNGEIDVAFNWANNLADGYKAAPGAVVWNLPEVYADALWFNVDENGHQSSAVRDVAVRKAIIQGINRADDTHQIQGADLSVPAAFDATNWWPDGITSITYDPDAAGKALDAAGWTDSNGDGTRDKNGEELILKFFTTTRQDRIDYQTAIAADLAKIGVGTQLYQVPGPAVLFALLPQRGVMATGDYDMAIYASSNDPISPNYDPPSWTCAGVPSADNPSGTNFSHYCDPAFDKLVDSIKSNLDPASRLDEKHQAVQLMTDAAVWNGLYQRVFWIAVAGDRFNADSFKGTFGDLASNWLQHPEMWTAK
jgi:peptide/nickel transport system substrate-binding protein